MHEKLIDDIEGIARQFHHLIDPRKTTDAQAEAITKLSRQVMVTLRMILQPSPAQLAILRARVDAACVEVATEQEAEIRSPSGAVH